METRPHPKSIVSMGGTIPSQVRANYGFHLWWSWVLSSYGGLPSSTGGLAENITDFHERSFRASGGLGVRLLLYGRVPIRLDYGVKVRPRCKVFAEDRESCIEKESPGELDFNLLYTF